MCSQAFLLLPDQQLSRQLSCTDSTEGNGWQRVCTLPTSPQVGNLNTVERTTESKLSNHILFLMKIPSTRYCAVGQGGTRETRNVKDTGMSPQWRR